MAVTKIKPIKSTLSKALDYIENPDKTDGKMLVSSFGCSYETADIEFEYTLSQALQKGNNLAFHLIQSFEPGEVDYQKAHEIGKQLADAVTKGQHEYVLTTHIDKGHVHNHIIFCAVNFVDHRKYNSNKRSYYGIRNMSDKLCRENGLSVVVPGKGSKGKSYAEYQAEKTGTSWKGKLKIAVDALIPQVSSFTGKGKIAVKPDKIRLYVNKEELCKEYEDTLRRSTEDTELLKDLFEKLGFQRKDLKTVYFNVDTEYESYQDRDKSWKRRFKGYKYNHHMKIEFAADNKRLGQVLYALAHSSLRPEFSIEYTVADVEKCKNELLHKAIEDSIQKAQVLTTAANVKLGEIQAIDYSWGEIDFVTKPLNEMRLMECTECEMSAPGAYDIDIEADDINVTDTATVIWEIA